MYRPRRTAPCRSSTRTAPCAEKPLWRQVKRFSTIRLGDELLAEQHAQHLGAKEAFEVAGVEVWQVVEALIRAEAGQSATRWRRWVTAVAGRE